MSRLHELTHLQRQFAEEHQETVLRFLSRMRLPVEDYYDIVIFGYLQAVQEYDENPALSRFQFDTIAWTKMSDCLGKHYAYANRPKRKAPTVSTYAYTKDGLTLDEILPDRNGKADGIFKGRWADLPGDRRNIFHHRTRHQRAVPPYEDAPCGNGFLSKGG